MSRGKGQAFTLVELLIVILIIGIIAAVAIPQFGDASTDAKKSAQKNNLQALRGSIDRYGLEHTSVWPGVARMHRKTVSGDAVKHTSEAEAFARQLTCYSDAVGNTCDERDPKFPYGPYIKRCIPENPMAAATAAKDPSGVTVTADTTPLKPDAKPSTGWKFSNQTGEIIANNPGSAAPPATSGPDTSSAPASGPPPASPAP